MGRPFWFTRAVLTTALSSKFQDSSFKPCARTRLHALHLPAPPSSGPEGRKPIAHGVSRGSHPQRKTSPSGATEADTPDSRKCRHAQVRPLPNGRPCGQPSGADLCRRSPKVYHPDLRLPRPLPLEKTDPVQRHSFSRFSQDTQAFMASSVNSGLSSSRRPFPRDRPGSTGATDPSHPDGKRRALPTTRQEPCCLGHAAV